MGKRKRVKESTNMNMNKNGNGNGESTSASSSIKIPRGRNHSAENKIRGRGNSSKKMKRGEASNSCMRIETGAGSSQNQESVVEETTINDLPPEMLTEILKYVDPATLVDCRLVSRQWSAISTLILTTKSDIMISFKEHALGMWELNVAPGGCREVRKMNQTDRLTKFINTMKESKKCPFASFFFYVDSPSFFGDENWIEFLSDFAPSNPNPNPNQIQNPRPKIKCLYLKYDSLDFINRLLLVTESLSDLLVNKIPHLEELGLEFTSIFENYTNVKLFPPPKPQEPESESESEPEEKSTKTDALSIPIPIPAQVQLPYLKMLEIEPGMFVKFPRVVEDLLKAAVNLTTIRVERPCLVKDVFTSQVFQFLHSLGKLHLLKKVAIHVDENFLSSLKTSTAYSDFPLAFKSSELELNLFACSIKPASFADATNFLSTLLESSKDTLEKLKMSHLGFLTGLQFPKLAKLRTLELKTCDYATLNDVERGQQFFPPGTRARSKEVFSTVDDLNITTSDWQRAFPQEDSIPIFPRVDTLCFNDYELVEENVITKLALMCPNLKHCTIQTLEGNPEQFNFAQVGRDIWTHLKQLESLEVDLDVNLPNHAFPALDSCFTGISTENCQALQNFMKAEKTRNKKRSRVKLQESKKWKTLTQREHPSILDMKNLKKLTVNPYSRKRQHQGKKFFTTKITWISEEFAFKLMPQLQFNGPRPSTSSRVML